jgi:hypothetical protein
MEWQCWPAAVVEATEVLVETRGEDGQWIADRRERSWAAYRQRTAGKPYLLSPHTAVWRSLSEALDPAGQIVPGRAQRFVRRYGPLTAIMDKAEPLGGLWQQTADQFRRLAELWGPPDDTGLSTWRTTRHVRHGVTVFLEAWLLGEQRRTPPPEGSLLRFCIEQALRQFAAHTPHRRCLGCHYWIEASRANRLHCTPTCRVAHARGFRATED